MKSRSIRTICVMAMAMTAILWIDVHGAGSIEQCQEVFKPPTMLENQQAATFPVKPQEYLPQAKNKAVRVQAGGNIREVVAYNSVPGQTDGSPCISADGSDICALHEKGERTCAANFVKFGTVLEIEGYGTCVVRDRMNSRYPQRVDVYMGEDVSAAVKFGFRRLNVNIHGN